MTIDISTVGIVSVPMPKRSAALETPRREAFRKCTSFGAGTLLGCRALEVAKLPHRGVIYTAVYGRTLPPEFFVGGHLQDLLRGDACLGKGAPIFSWRRVSSVTYLPHTSL